MTVVIQAKKRPKGNLNKLRREGKLPANIYGYNIEATPIVVDYIETRNAVLKHGHASVFKIDVEGKQVNAILQEIQRCPIKGTVKHIDFLSINMSEEIEVDIPVKPVGEAIGVKEGGVLNQPLRELKIKVKPTNMPESLDVDISNLGIGDTLFVSDIRDQFEYEILHNDDETVITITPPATARDAGQGDNDELDVKSTEAPESEN